MWSKFLNVTTWRQSIVGLLQYKPVPLHQRLSSNIFYDLQVASATEFTVMVQMLREKIKQNLLRCSRVLNCIIESIATVQAVTIYYYLPTCNITSTSPTTFYSKWRDGGMITLKSKVVHCSCVFVNAKPS